VGGWVGIVYVPETEDEISTSQKFVAKPARHMFHEF
jgi:hypothetical protein